MSYFKEAIKTVFGTCCLDNQFLNAIQQQQAEKDTEIFSVFLCVNCARNIYDRKYLAVKITDFCLPSEKLIKCLS